MRLRSLELQGFKSFPDRIKIQFGDGITAVVGPNGSGKSNISDAVRWVLGEQSNKNLRGASREDVIFNGTATRKAQGYAEVTLTIDNTNRRLAFDGDLVAVTRRYYRSGNSEYLINKATVRLSDIRNLFFDTGLGRDGYSMIGQGKISNVVECRPEERREMFEEAAGIAKFRHRKKDAERDLDRADEQLVRVLDILSGLEERVGPLKLQSEKAEAFLSLAAEKKNLEIGLWLHTLEQSARILREQENKILTAQGQQEAVHQSLEETAREIEEIYMKSGEAVAEVDTIRRAASAYESEAVQKEGEVTLRQSDIRHNEENRERIEAEMAQSELSHKQLEAEIAEREEAIAADRGIVEEKRGELDHCTEELENLTTGMSQSSDRLEAANKEISRISSAVSEARVAFVTAESSRQEIEARQKTVEQGIAEQTARGSELETELSETRQMHKETEENCEALQNAVKGYEIRYTKRKDKLEKCKREADELRLKAEEKLRRARILEELERNMEGFNASVKIVIQEHSRGNLRGIHGAVSRLIRVPEEYSTAVETALGAAIQNIVTDTEEDAKRAIFMLKQKKAGRATFLPLSSVRGSLLQEKGLDSCPGFLGIASTLIQYDSQYETVLRSLLGRVVVAEDMDSAVAIAKKYGYRFRVVTLDGQVVNAGGSLTGGSLVRHAGVLGRANEIERIHAEAQALKGKAAEAEEQRKQAEAEAASAEADILGVRGELAAAQEERIRMEAECRRLSEQKESTENAIKLLEKEEEESKERLRTLEREQKRAGDEEALLGMRLSEQENILRELTGDKEDFSLKREAITTQMNNIRMEIMSAEKDAEGHNGAISDIRARMTDSAQRKRDLAGQIEGLEAENREIEAAIERLKEEAAALRRSVTDSGAQIETLNQTRMALEKRSAELREQERAKSSERDVVGRELTRLEERKVNLQKEYDDIIARLWDEYELTRSEAQALSIEVEDPRKAGRQLSELKSRIKALGNVNVGAIEEYKEVSEQYETLKTQVEDIQTSRDQIRKQIGELTVQMREIFIDRFRLISLNFEEIFQEMFGGGEAGLALSNPDDVLETGIEIIARPPEKRVGLLSLSGGEKTMVALTLYFAIMKVNPPPFCVLDEVEAALDEVNVEQYAAFLRKMCDKTQFIAITHRRGTMEEADVLYGVTMQEKGITKMLELNIAEMAPQ